MEPLIDVNVNLSRWPMRRIREDETPRLVAKLASHGVVEAWVGSFDGLLHKDIASVNARLAEECRASSKIRLVPFGSINPMLPDWEEDLRRCAEDHKMPGIRLHPNYHGYTLDAPVFSQLLELATRLRLIVALAVTMEDERMMHPLLRVPVVDTSRLHEIVSRTPGSRLLLTNALGGSRRRGEALLKLLRAGEVYVEISSVEGLGGVGELLQAVPLERILFGSHAPLLYFEAALFKLHESSLAQPQLQAIRHENARRLLPVNP